MPTPAARISTGLHPIAMIAGLCAGTEELTTAVTGSTAIISVDRVTQRRSFSTRSRRLQWAKVQPALSVAGMVATRESTSLPPRVSANNRDTADAAPPPTSAKPPSATSFVELTIDSLHSYELIKPIPVIVESLGDRNYVAEMPDLNISTTAANPSDILITLKDRIAQVYNGLRIKKNLDAEQTRQLQLLETYIGSSRRSWLDRR